VAASKCIKLSSTNRVMHKMTSTMHKNLAPEIIGDTKDYSSAAKENNVTKKNYNNKNINEDTTIQGPLPAKMIVLDIERENRLSKVISLYSKGLNQEETAYDVHVDQSTISRDLHFIKHEARKQVENYLREDILFEYLRYMAGSNEITRQLWQIAQNKDVTVKEKSNAL
jgi:hypothetical protein